MHSVMMVALPDVAPNYLTYYTDDVDLAGWLPMFCDMLYPEFGDERLAGKLSGYPEMDST